MGVTLGARLPLHEWLQLNDYLKQKQIKLPLWYPSGQGHLSLSPILSFKLEILWSKHGSIEIWCHENNLLYRGPAPWHV